MYSPAPITPGVAPPYLQAAAWPNSWKAADSTIIAHSASTIPGWKTAWWSAEARPFSTSTHQLIAANASSTGIATTGANSAANGAVRRRVTRSLVMTTFSLSASSGLFLRVTGSAPSAATTRPSGASFSVTRYCTSSAVMCRSVESETSWANESQE